MIPRHQARAGHDRWLVSYADLVTLLLALFTTLYAASVLDAHKVDPLAESLRHAMTTTTPVVAVGDTPAVVPPAELVSRLAAFEELKARLARDLDDAVRAQRLEIATDGRGLVISLPERATFAIGSADVTPEARTLIGRVAATIAVVPNQIRVEGHTDDVPIRTPRFASNWELSTARASAVVAYLIETAGVDPSRLSASGYGEFHPRVPNTSAENRARNRRIDLVVLESVEAGTAGARVPQESTVPATDAAGAAPSSLESIETAMPSTATVGAAHVSNESIRTAMPSTGGAAFRRPDITGAAQ